MERLTCALLVHKLRVALTQESPLLADERVGGEAELVVVREAREQVDEEQVDADVLEADRLAAHGTEPLGVAVLHLQVGLGVEAERVLARGGAHRCRDASAEHQVAEVHNQLVDVQVARLGARLEQPPHEVQRAARRQALPVTNLLQQFFHREPPSEV